MLLLDLILRNEIPLALRLALLGMILLITVLYILVPHWFTSMRLLAYLPIQRFAWQSEKHTVNNFFRISSILSISIVYAIFIFAHVESEKLFLLENGSLNFLIVWGAILFLTALKFFLNSYYFGIHQHQNLGNLVVDYQYSINQIFALLLGVILLVDVFYFNLESALFLVAVVVVLVLFLIKLFGTILMIQNNFNYPILSLFVYLCTFEIVPILIVAKVLFVNS
jgi:hypothetical protein